MVHSMALINQETDNNKILFCNQFNEEGKITADLEYFDLGGVFDQLEE